VPSSTDQSRAAAAVLPPQWVDDVDGIHEALSDITRLMSILGSMHASRVGTVFGKDLDDMEEKIENHTKDITGEERYCSSLSCTHHFDLLYFCS